AGQDEHTEAADDPRRAHVRPKRVAATGTDGLTSHLLPSILRRSSAGAAVAAAYRDDECTIASASSSKLSPLTSGMGKTEGQARAPWVTQAVAIPAWAAPARSQGWVAISVTSRGMQPSSSSVYAYTRGWGLKLRAASTPRTRSTRSRSPQARNVLIPDSAPELVR